MHMISLRKHFWGGQGYASGCRKSFKRAAHSIRSDATDTATRIHAPVQWRTMDRLRLYPAFRLRRAIFKSFECVTRYKTTSRARFERDRHITTEHLVLSCVIYKTQSCWQVHQRCPCTTSCCRNQVGQAKRKRVLVIGRSCFTSGPEVRELGASPAGHWGESFPEVLPRDVPVVQNNRLYLYI